MSKRTIRRQLAREAARQRSCFRRVTVTIDLPAQESARAPRWAPEGYEELAPASTWAMARHDGWCHVMAITHARDMSSPVITGGLVRPGVVGGPWGVAERPWLLRAMGWRVEEHPLREWPQAEAYHLWHQDTLEAAMAAAGSCAGYCRHPWDPRWCAAPAVVPDGIGLAPGPSGRWRLEMTAVLDAAWLSDDVTEAAGVVCRVVRSLGPGCRVRASRGPAARCP